MSLINRLGLHARPAKPNDSLDVVRHGNDNNAAIRMKAAVAKPGDAPAAAEAAMQAAFVYLLARITVRVAALVGANIGVAAHRPIFVALLLTN